MIQHVSYSSCPLKPLIVSAAVCAHMTPELVLASSVMLVVLIIVRKNVLIARPLLRRCQVIHAAPFNCNGAATFPSQHHAQQIVAFSAAPSGSVVLIVTTLTHVKASSSLHYSPARATCSPMDLHPAALHPQPYSKLLGHFYWQLCKHIQYLTKNSVQQMSP